MGQDPAVVVCNRELFSIQLEMSLRFIEAFWELMGLLSSHNYYKYKIPTMCVWLLRLLLFLLVFVVYLHLENLLVLVCLLLLLRLVLVQIESYDREQSATYASNHQSARV